MQGLGLRVETGSPMAQPGAWALPRSSASISSTPVAMHGASHYQLKQGRPEF